MMVSELPNLEQLRNDTPGCERRIHLNNAGAGLMPRPVLEAIQNHLNLESQIGGYEAAEACAREIERAYHDAAQVLGTQATNIAFVENATVGFAQALSSIPFQAGDVILTTTNDYISNQLMFMSLAKRLGIRIIHAEDCLDGGADLDSVAELMDRHHPRLVAVTHIPTNSGLIQPVEEIGALCKEREMLYLVDSCQAVGQLPVDVNRIGCDFMSVTSRKFLRGPRGCGFMYVSDRVLESDLEPLFIDMQGAKWTDSDQYQLLPTARRFENWEFAYALVLGTGAAARYAIEVGIESISRRAFALAKDLRDQVGQLPGVRVLDRGNPKCAIVTFNIDGLDPQRLLKAMADANINTTLSLREYAVIDFGRKNVEWALRVSPHYYNSETEIAAAVEAVSSVAGR